MAFTPEQSTAMANLLLAIRMQARASITEASEAIRLAERARQSATDTAAQCDAALEILEPTR